MSPSPNDINNKYFFRVGSADYIVILLTLTFQWITFDICTNITSVFYHYFLGLRFL